MNIERIKLDRFQPRQYQLPLMRELEKGEKKRFLCVWARRAGKDVCAFNAILRAALNKIAVYYYVFPTYSQAKKVIWDSITNTGHRFLDYIPPELVQSKNSQEMKIILKNGSLIQLVGSDNIDSLVGTNPAGVVFSEYAIQSPLAYQFLRPILLANRGWSLFISCVSPNTLVIGKNGLQRIESVSNSREEYSDLNEPIYGLGGFHNAEQFYYGGKQNTLKITLASGYEIECTPVHQLWNGEKWIKSQDLVVGDLIPIQYGQDVWGEGFDALSDFYYKRQLGNYRYSELAINFDSIDFMYLLGLIHADGNYTDSTVCVTKNKDPEIIQFLNKIGFKTRKDGIHHEFSSREFCSFLEYLGFKHGARNKTFPDILFTCTKDQMRAFLQGLFDGDGTSNSNPSKKGNVKLTSTNESLLKDIQVVLLNFGVVSSIRSEFKKPTKRVKVSSMIYNLEIGGYFAHIFYRDIGFRLARKQKNYINIPPKVQSESGNIYPIDETKLSDYSLPKHTVANKSRITRRLIKKLNNRKKHPYLEQLLSEKLFYSTITSIVTTCNKVYDFIIPETKSFFTNGFISHNTPRGKNHFWDLYNIALNNPSDWFVSKLSVLDTGHISLEDIKKEIGEGLMSEDLSQQEYFVSFELGVEGSYYTKLIDRMSLNGQLGNVPWDPSYKVYTAWDIGRRDCTSIIFYQVAGQIIRIIDCYERSKESLEHYVGIVKSKPYIYGSHFVPHDIKVNEWGSGITRIEKAKRLGLLLTVVENHLVEDGIEAVRSVLPRVWINTGTCAKLIESLENYRQSYDLKKKVYKKGPLHDWASHFADAMRYLAVSLPKTRDGMTPEDLDRIRNEALYGSQSNLPPVFRDTYNGPY